MKMTLKDAFAMVDNVCLNAVRGISDLVIAPASSTSTSPTCGRS